jgi:hypothetical protein
MSLWNTAQLDEPVVHTHAGGVPTALAGQGIAAGCERKQRGRSKMTLTGAGAGVDAAAER